ncbi:MAG: hypothetical protein U9R28_09240 [Pseudomonadota bacterium]|nr:hypothetical protein [Pseudomonadota bacterium]
MSKEVLEQQLSHLWKKLLKANIQHDQHKVASLQRKIICLEIEQKHQHH